MKYLVLIAVLLVVGWFTWGRRKRGLPPADAARKSAAKSAGTAADPAAAKSAPKPAPKTPGKNSPQPMLACAHCGVHLPQADAVLDTQGRSFCGAAHQLAGPR
jgi:uncharacterized protein